MKINLKHVSYSLASAEWVMGVIIFLQQQNIQLHLKNYETAVVSGVHVCNRNKLFNPYVISRRWFPRRSVYSRVNAGHYKSARRIQGRFPMIPEKRGKTASALDIISNGFSMCSKTVSGNRNLFEKVSVAEGKTYQWPFWPLLGNCTHLWHWP